MIEFLKGIFYALFYENINLNLFNKDILDNYLLGRNKFVNSLKMKGNYREVNGFKSKIIPDSLIVFYDNLKFLKNKKFDKVFDLGAYIGDTAYWFVKSLKPKKIFAFEPDPDNMMYFKENIGINNLEKKVLPIQMATGIKNDFFYLIKGVLGSMVSKKSWKQN